MKLIILFFVVGSLCQVVNSAVPKWSSTLTHKSIFRVEPKLQQRVNFWVQIYSKYTTRQGVFHLPERPDIILGQVDLTDIYTNFVYSDRQKEKLANKKIREARAKVAFSWKIKNPDRIRLQMGLKDRMERALFLSGRYLPMMETIFKENGLPTELTRIVFVESSFNILAQSKVGASGLWQIMPEVARPEGYLQKNYDKRNHPYFATLLAADILKQNYKSLKSWPLAITAYNHGLTGVRKMVSRVGSRSVVDLIESDDRTVSWGFASENFYACFLAVLEVEKNARSLFGEKLVRSEPMVGYNVKLKTTVDIPEILSWYGGSQKRFREFNPHLKWTMLNKKRYFPAGIPLVLPQTLVSQATLKNEY